MLQSRTSQGDPDIYYFRTGSAASALSPADVTGLDLREWDAVHLTGILPAISPTALAASYMLADKARKAGVPVFFRPQSASTALALPGLHGGRGQRPGSSG